jgi:GT2 family glycosyltransferase
MNRAASTATIDVIIVNYCTGSFVLACLESLVAEQANIPALRVIVVDNASGDQSFETICDHVSERGWTWVTPLQSGENRGFGAGNNFAIDWILAGDRVPDFLWLLNPDTRVTAGAGAALIRFMQSKPAAGLAGSALLESDGELWPFAFRFPSILGEIERGARLRIITRLLGSWSITLRMGKRCERVDWVPGASLIIRRELVENGVRFDEGYFLYYEETDFCLSARRQGWECWYVPDAIVLHIAGQSTGVTDKQAKMRRLPSYWFHSRRRYFIKNHGRLYGIVADIGWLVAHLLARSKQVIRGGSDSDPPNLLGDFLRHSALIPRF